MYSVIEDLEKAKGLMTVKEISKILRTGEQTIYLMAREKQIPSLNVRAKVLFDPKTISYWIRKQNPAFAKAARDA